MHGNLTDWTESEHAVLLETYAFLSALAEASLINVYIDDIDITGETRDTCTSLLNIIERTQSELSADASHNKLTALKKNFSVMLGAGFGYEFTDGDLERVQVLLNELRSLVANVGDISDEHRQRLLKRLEQLQSELHKKTDDLSRYYGLLGDAGVALGKFGENAKPIVDRVREILQITWRTQARAEELPSGTTPPLLERDSD
jgi:hypothetical protein